MDKKPHLVFIGHIGAHTGLARVGDNLLRHLCDRWRVTVVSLSHPPDYECPYRLLNGIFADDRLGRFVTRKLCETDPPDLICAYYDATPVSQFLDFMPTHLPICAYVPVDSCNVMDGHKLNRLLHGIFFTEFGLRETRTGGYTGPASVIGHGVDLDLYQPKDMTEARAKLGLPRTAFIVGAINRNQPRKRFDLTLYAFKLFLDQTQATDAFLYCHCAPRAEGWDLAPARPLLGHWASRALPYV